MLDASSRARATTSPDLRRLGLIAAVLGCVALSIPSCEKNPAPGSDPATNPGEGDDGTKVDESKLVVSEHACQTDADCAPASCCHATACVAAGDAPACDEMVCTTECAEGTMDCGGGCLCHEGFCTAQLAS
ncbi:MAG: hypothetical protein AAF799_42005 [Myxococcota bacterium]